MASELTPTEQRALDIINSAGSLPAQSEGVSMQTVQALAARGLINLGFHDDIRSGGTRYRSWTAYALPDFGAWLAAAVAEWLGVEAAPIEPFAGPLAHEPRVIDLAPNSPLPAALGFDISRDRLTLHVAGWVLSFEADITAGGRGGGLRATAGTRLPWGARTPLVAATGVVAASGEGLRAFVGEVLTGGLSLARVADTAAARARDELALGTDYAAWYQQNALTIARAVVTESIEDADTRAAARLLAAAWTGTPEELRTTAAAIAA